MNFYDLLKTDSFKQRVLDTHDKDTIMSFTKFILIMEELGVNMSSPDSSEDTPHDFDTALHDFNNDKPNTDLALQHDLMTLRSLYAEAFKHHYTQVLFDKGLKLSYVEALAFCQHSESLDRGYMLLKMFHVLTLPDFMQLFFEQWTAIEIADDIYKEFKSIFSLAPMELLMKQYASEDDLITWQNLPEEITVYRGCSTSTKDGLSWSTDIKTAKIFASRRWDMFNDGLFKLRLAVSTHTNETKQWLKNLAKRNEEVFIVKAVVKRNDMILFGSRNESEVFSCRPKIVDEILITSHDQINTVKF